MPNEPTADLICHMPTEPYGFVEVRATVPIDAVEETVRDLYGQAQRGYSPTLKGAISDSPPPLNPELPSEPQLATAQTATVGSIRRGCAAMGIDDAELALMFEQGALMGKDLLRDLQSFADMQGTDWVAQTSEDAQAIVLENLRTRNKQRQQA